MAILDFTYYGQDTKDRSSIKVILSFTSDIVVRRIIWLTTQRRSSILFLVAMIIVTIWATS